MVGVASLDTPRPCLDLLAGLVLPGYRMAVVRLIPSEFDCAASSRG
jgi:hypothetical protein